MKRIIILLALLLGILAASAPVQAQSGNLLLNGSFKQGFEHWEHYSQSKVVNKGKCGRHSVVLKNSYIRDTSYSMTPGKKYRLSFWYRGKLVTGVTSAIHLQADKWTFFSQEFGDAWNGSVWFMGDFARAQVDCVKLKEVG